MRRHVAYDDAGCRLDDVRSLEDNLPHVRPVDDALQADTPPLVVPQCVRPRCKNYRSRAPRGPPRLTLPVPRSVPDRSSNVAVVAGRQRRPPHSRRFLARKHQSLGHRDSNVERVCNTRWTSSLCGDTDARLSSSPEGRLWDFRTNLTSLKLSKKIEVWIQMLIKKLDFRRRNRGNFVWKKKWVLRSIWIIGLWIFLL